MDAIIGSEAVAAGTLTRGQLRWGYDPIFPDVYLPKDAPRTVLNLAHAAWLWSGRSGVIAGRTAAGLLGVTWVDVDAPVELICTKRSSSTRLLTRCGRLAHDEIVRLHGLPVTSAARTALDLARHCPRDVAVTHLDALAAATDVSAVEIMDLVHRYRRGARVTEARGGCFH